MWGPGQESMWHEYQYFCSKGYGIVYILADQGATADF
jgi:hypothetical protein